MAYKGEAQTFYSHLKDTSDLRVLRPKGFSWAHVSGSKAPGPWGRNSHTKRYGQSRGKTHGGMANPSCAEAQCLHSKESVLHRSVSVSFLLHLSLSLSEPLQLVCGRRWLTERLIFLTISSPAKRLRNTGPTKVFLGI